MTVVKSRHLKLVASAALLGTMITGNTVMAASTSSSSAPPLTISDGPNGNFQDNFNPFVSGPNPGTQGLIYETLFYFDAVSGKTFDILGSSYKWSNHNKTVEVTLRKNAKWSDGTPFTSADVVFTFNQIKKYSDSDLNGVWQQLSSVQAEGPYKVKFNFKQGDVPFGNQFVLGDTYIVPKHIWSKLGDPSKSIVTKPVGTGPYVLKSFSQQLLTYQVNAHYYLGKPAVQTVQYPAYTSNENADLALSDGSLQWTGVMIPNIQKVYTSVSSHNHYWFAPNVPNNLTGNLSNPILKQLPVRQAMSLAIDRNKISKSGEDGYEKPASPTALVLPNQNSWLDPKLPKSDLTFQHNPAKAEKILEKAGFKKNSKGIFETKSGQPLAFTLLTVSGWSDWDTDALLIKQDLQQIGIQVTVQELSYGAYENDISPSSRHYQLAITSMSGGPTPFTAYYNMLDPKGNTDYEGLNDATLNKVFSNYTSSTSASQQKQDIYKMEQYFVNELPGIPLTDGADWYEYNDTHYTGWPTQSNPWITGSPYNGQSAAIILRHLKPVK